MSTASTIPETAERAVVYPPIEEPEIGSGKWGEVGPGVRWMRMPLKGSLGAINVWAIADGEGWTVVDSGIRSPETVKAWRAAEGLALERRPVRRLVVTHMHPDHSGMVGWLASEYRAQLWMTRLEYFVLQMLARDTAAAPDAAVEFYRVAGMGEEWLDLYRTRFGSFGKMMYPLPVQFHAIGDGDTVRIGERDWTCIVGEGHSPEHACFWNREERLFISGDQVLPTISSNVSVYPYEPDADPLSDWLRTLARIGEIVPDDVLVLPAHGRPFHGLQGRIAYLIQGHERGLERLHALLETPRRAVDTYSALFRRVSSDAQIQMMAVGEALAHLACLRSRGLATCWADDDGVIWWKQADIG